MTSIQKESTFNIFQILSAGDKELVHSSMLKFLLEKYPLFLEEFLGDKFEHISEISIDLEISDKVLADGINKRLRFDLVVKDESRKWLFAIENKFKATPTVYQLKLYDKYFEQQKILNVENPSQKATKKFQKKVMCSRI